MPPAVVAAAAAAMLSPALIAGAVRYPIYTPAAVATVGASGK